ncbi:hypothetical protein [uncultured Roseibium sp.]|uniref:hypothetical protein n=1 Tax=uncultured Roseibium sp. TaxID=1936171 RepID=UPI00321631DE
MASGLSGEIAEISIYTYFSCILRICYVIKLRMNNNDIEEILFSYTKAFKFKDSGQIKSKFTYAAKPGAHGVDLSRAFDNLHSFDDQPAIVHYDRQGNVIEMQWRDQNRPHRLNGPAVLKFTPGKKYPHLECWYQDENLHRIGAASLIRRDPDSGEILEALYYINGKKLNKAETRKNLNAAVDLAPKM